MYNHDLAGSRYNPAETAIGRSNAGQLVEKWRFPARGSERADRGHPRHADGRRRLRLLRHGDRPDLLQAGARRQALLGLPQADPLGADRPRRVGGGRGAVARLPVPVRVRGDHDLGPGDRGHRLFRRPGRLVLRPRSRRPAPSVGRSTRGPPTSPAPTPSTSSSPRRSSPTARSSPAAGRSSSSSSGGLFYRGSTGRGFLLALDPKTGRIAWKYDLGPKPERFDPPMTIKDSWGTHFFYYGPATSTIWSTPSYDAESGTLFFGTDVNTAPRRPTLRRPPAAHARVVRGRRARRAHREGAVGHADQAGRRLDQRHARLRPQGGPAQGPVDRRHAQDLHDPGGGQADEGGRRGLQGRRLLRPARLGREADRPHADLHRPADLSALARAGPADARPAELHRRPADGLRHRRQDDLHQRDRRDPADVAGEDGGQRRAADGRAGGRHQRGHADRALAARAAEGRLARRPAAEARVHRRRRPGRLGPRRGQRRGLLHRPWPAASSSPSTPRPAASSRRSRSAPSGRGPPSPAAASTSAPAIPCSPPPTPRRSSPRNSPASSTPSACPARTRSIGSSSVGRNATGTAARPAPASADRGERGPDSGRFHPP